MRAGTAIGGPGTNDRGPLPGSSWARLPRTYKPAAPPRDLPDAWPKPPDVANPIEILWPDGRPTAAPRAMDLALFEALNEEFREKPLVPEPLSYEMAAAEDRARRRLLQVHRTIDLAEKRVLEVGCGAGYEVWYLGHVFDADAWGVDVVQREGWPVLADEVTHLVCADLATSRPFDEDSFDRAFSTTVLEHVEHPYSLLAEVYRILRPGGLFYLNSNLHRGPLASHIYREVRFPYPHLLFSDDVVREFRRAHGGPDEGAAWVNTLTWSQYEDYFREIGFVMRSLSFRETPIDEDFYRRFDDILGRYPRWDLSRDFFTTVLEKPSRAPRRR